MVISRQLKIMKAFKAKNARKAMKANESDKVLIARHIDELTEIAKQVGFNPDWVPDLPNEIKIMVLTVQIAKSNEYAEYRRMTSHA